MISSQELVKERLWALVVGGLVSNDAIALLGSYYYYRFVGVALAFDLSTRER